MILEFCQEEAVDVANFNTPSWNPNLNLIARSYAAGIISEPNPLRQAAPHRRMTTVPFGIARRIAESPQKYPDYLVAFAEASCREAVASKIIPVGDIAQRDRWFTE
jgi:hypothetical protein